MIALMPHGSCFLWNPWLTSLHSVSDGLILVSYFFIPLLLLLNRQYIDSQVRPPLLLFAAFIFSCGIGHGLRVWNIWHTNYWIEGAWAWITAVVSLYTAWKLKGVFPPLLSSYKSLVSLSQMAELDPLTGIANRRGLEAAIEALAYQPEEIEHTLVLVDLDGFKTINDTYGHNVGDLLLQAVAEVLRHQVRTVDLAARVGGDEFSLLLVGCPPIEASDKAETIRQQIQQINLPQIQPTSDTPLLSASIGVSGFRASQGLTQGYRHADAALYAAKHSGKNQVGIASSAPLTEQPR